MTNRPKAIGTAGETAVVRYAREHGFPHADRRPLKGNADEGDILLCPGAILEVKAGKAAQKASEQQIADWLAETEVERINARADVAALVTARAGYGPARVGSWRFWWIETFPFGPLVASCSLHDGLLRLRHGGWGTEL